MPVKALAVEDEPTHTVEEGKTEGAQMRGPFAEPG
jgi:hypothetical protein